jgi:hypothetical protein
MTKQCRSKVSATAKPKSRAAVWVVGLSCLAVLLATPALFAAEAAQSAPKKSVAENALYESMVCRALAIKSSKPEDAAIWGRLTEELAKMVAPPEQQRARTLADSALFDMSKAELKQEKAFCAQVLQQRRQKEKNQAKPPEAAKKTGATDTPPPAAPLGSTAGRTGALLGRHAGAAASRQSNAGAGRPS